MATREKLHKEINAVPDDQLADVRLVVDPVWLTPPGSID
jgi:hypothetical protein